MKLFEILMGIRRSEHYIIMGEVAAKICGGEGPLKMLMQEYGDDIGKFIAIEKVKIFLDSQVAGLKSQIDGQSSKLKA